MGLSHSWVLVFMFAYYADHFVLPLPEGHRFPMAKYRMLRDAVAHHLPHVCLAQAPVASDGELALVHDPAYIGARCRATAWQPIWPAVPTMPMATRAVGFACSMTWPLPQG